MIIHVKQTQSNLQAVYEIIVDGQLAYHGRTPWTAAVFSSQLFDPDVSLIYETRFQPLKEILNMIPFKWAWTEQLSECSMIFDKNGQPIGVVNHGLKGVLNPYYNLSMGEDSFKIYSVSKGKKVHLLFVDESDRQIAQGEKVQTVQNNLDTYRLFLLDDSARFSDIFSLFILYYDNWNYGNNGELVSGTVEKSWEWSFDKNTKRYDPLWIRKHFGEVPEVDTSSADQQFKKNLKIFGFVFGTIILVVGIYLLITLN